MRKIGLESPRYCYSVYDCCTHWHSTAADRCIIVYLNDVGLSWIGRIIAAKVQ